MGESECLQMGEGVIKRYKLIGLLALLFCLAGLYISIDLSWLHYRVYTDSEFHSFCAINDSFNCETVAESTYSIFLGIPVSVWGVFAYLIMSFLALAIIFSKGKELPYALLLLLSGAAVVVSVILALISYCVICSICLLCSATYLVNIALLILLLTSVKLRQFPWERSFKAALQQLKAYKLLVLCGLLSLGILLLIYPKYWEKKQHTNYENGMSGSTLNSSPWIGAAEPMLTVIEYSDYLCPHCRRGHRALREWVRKHPGKIKLIHRQFPLDEKCNQLLTRPFHPGACVLAKAAYCAGEQGEFWEMNDRLYQGISPKGDLKEALMQIAQSIVPDQKAFSDCLDSERADRVLKEDIEAALNLDIKGTPSLVVDNKVYLGMLPQEMLQQLEEGK